MQNKEIFKLNIVVSKYYSFLEYYTDSIIKKGCEDIFFTPFSLIRKIEIDNDTDQEYKELVLRFRFSSPLFDIPDVNITSIGRREKSLIHQSIKTRTEDRMLYSIREETDVNVMISILEKETTRELYSINKTIHVLPYNDRSLDKFPSIEMLSQFCSPIPLPSEENGIKAYQGEEKSDVINQVSQLYHHFWKESTILLSNPQSQRELFHDIQNPEETANQKKGNSLELSLLFADELCKKGYHPILVLCERQVFCGCFLSGYDTFSSYVEKKPTLIYSDAVGEDQKFILFDCACFNRMEDVSFFNAMERANECIRAYRGDFSCIDINRCQNSYYKSLPRSSQEIEIPSYTPKVEEIEFLHEFENAPFRLQDATDRFSTWEKKLLDLSINNRLVNFSCATIAKVMDVDGVSFYNRLKREKGVIKAKSVSSLLEKENGRREQIDDEELLNRIEALCKSGLYTLEATPSFLKELIRKDNSSREETGSPTLYLALGQLNGEDSINPKTAEVRDIHAPFLLIPITMKKERNSSEHHIFYDLENLMVNKTFFEYYKLKKDVDYSYLYDVDSSMHYEDIIKSFHDNQESDVTLDENQIFIANFSFSHMVMWQDVVSRRETLSQNVVIKSLLENKSFIENSTLEAKHIDELDHAEDFAAPLPYDSTQLKAIRECVLGNSFILDGPPGTGKSQTIVNMIVNAFYHQKTVLFVAEKQAALEVVRQRLANLGLDNFALQLYSPNTSKSSMFAQLGRVMDMGKQSSDEDFKKTCEDIEQEKSLLNEELRKLHSRKDYFYSLYEAITKKLSNDEVSVKLHFTPEFIHSYDGEKNDEIRILIDKLTTTYEKLFNMEEGKFLPYVRMSHLTYQEQVALCPTFTKVLDALDKFEESYSAFAAEMKENTKPTKNEVEENLFFYDFVFNRKTNLKKVAKEDYFSDPDSIENSIQALLEYHSLEEKYSKKYHFQAIPDTNPELAKSELGKGTNFLNKPFAKKKAIQALEPMLLNTKLQENEIQDAIEVSSKVNGLLENINANKKLQDEFFAMDCLNDASKDESLMEIYQNTLSLHNALKNNQVPDYLQKFENLDKVTDLEKLKLTSLFKTTYEDSKSLQDEIEKAGKDYLLNTDSLGIRNYFEEYQEFYSFLIDDKKQKIIYDFAFVNQAINRLKELGLENYAKALEDHSIPLDEISKTYERALSTSFITAYFSNDEFNNDFDEEKYNKEITKYQDLIQRYNSLCVGETIEKLTNRFLDPNLERSSQNPLGALRKLVMTSGRGISIRNTLSKYEDLIRMYFPCFLMSPLSAAQYLDVNARKFDIVIFDEASQIPTSEAIGPIARGNALIVAGDPQQMPPSNYFSVNVSASEDELSGEGALIEDAESLLDDCLALKLPRIRLAFHYRSRHESLIQFSNTNFYGGDLFTFPSRDNKTSHISFLHIDAETKKKSSDISDQEIKAILDLLEKLLTEETTKDKSIGIIVFNTKQQAKLYDEVDSFLNRHPKYLTQTHWNEEASNEKLFVKNLENVQGDERDIIIMSIGFAKNENTSKALISGPLTLDKGERRLNVAASRSKEQMIILSTIYSADIDIDNRKNNGAKALKNFLSFAEKESLPTNDEIIDSPNKDLAYFIRNELHSKGYECDISIGHSEFKIDLAVRRKDSSEYLLGILLDEKPLNGNISCRDRFYVEPTILHSLNWKVLRIYTYSFLRFKDDTINNIIKMIEETEKECVDDQEKFVPPVMTKHNVESEGVDYHIVPYEEYPFSITDYLNYEEMDTNYYDPESVELVKRIVKAESPISVERLKDYFRKAFSIKQLSSKACTIISNQINNARVIKTEDYRHKIFLWDPEKESIKVDCFRESDRDILDIPKEEIIFLMNQIIRVYQNIDKEDLIRETASRMKLEIISSRMRGKLEYTLDYAIKHQLLEKGYQENY